MIFSQVKHLVKINNDFYSNMTWSTTLYIYFLPTHPPIYLVNCLPTYLSIYTFSLIYIPTHPPTYYLITYPMTYLPNFNHYV